MTASSAALKTELREAYARGTHTKGKGSCQSEGVTGCLGKSIAYASTLPNEKERETSLEDDVRV